MRIACAALLLAIAIPASAQSQPRFRVQVHAGGDPALRERVVSGVTRALEPVADVEVVSRNPEYFVSVIVLPAAGGGYVMSIAVMNVYTDEALSNFAELWGIGESARERMIAVLTGAGALVDQRIVTGSDMDTMTADIARALNVDVLGTVR